MPEQGDIVLIPVPFTDLSTQKQRPVVVISNNIYNRQSADIVVVAMTSNPAQDAYSFAITSSDLQHGALNRPGKVRVDKVYTLSQTICPFMVRICPGETCSAQSWLGSFLQIHGKRFR